MKFGPFPIHTPEHWDTLSISCLQYNSPHFSLLTPALCHASKSTRVPFAGYADIEHRLAYRIALIISGCCYSFMHILDHMCTLHLGSWPGQSIVCRCSECSLSSEVKILLNFFHMQLVLVMPTQNVIIFNPVHAKGFIASWMGGRWTCGPLVLRSQHIHQSVIHSMPQFYSNW
jgi:hypothetical protein